MGRFNEASSELRRAQQLDPLSLIINADLSRPFYYARQWDRSIEQCRKTLEMDPNFAPARRYLGLSYMGKRMYAEAVEEFKKASSASGDSSLMRSELGHAYALAGQAADARKILDDLMALSANTYVPSYHIAVLHTGLGQNDDAVEWFRKALAEKSTSCVFMKHEPILESLRSDPRFQALIDRIGL
jgi:tetratricopeptide (TPR) repeat protein